MTEGLEQGIEALNRFNELSDAPLAESALAARRVIEAAAPAIRKQERQRIREALREQAAECRREAEEARRRGDQDGSERLSSAADVVHGVTLIIFDFSEGPDA